MKLKKTKATILPVILVVVVLAICTLSTGASSKAPWPTKEWPRSTPEQQKLDPVQLKELVRLIREGKKFPDLHSLLIVRKGYLVLEEYFAGYDADSIHTLQSVSKSFTSAMIGIAVQQKKIKSIDEKILDFFPNVDKIKNMEKRKAAMKLRDLLTMRSGTDYHEGYTGSPHSRLNKLEKGWDRFYLDREMIREPGSYFRYDSGGVILMSSILKNRTGMHADAFAQRYLFPPLGISKVKWFKNKEGHPHTGGGLYLQPRDMAKFGLLYSRGGRWEDRQVVPARWVKESVRMHVTFEDQSSRRRDKRSIGYGFLWWILPPDPKGVGKSNIYAAMGFRAQYIFVIPEHDMVVVVTGGTRSGVDQRKPIGFLYTHILPSVRR
ncbi:MAG: serine hydrolase [bacterium]|nr:serine hydrolase [bacterium]